MVLTAIAAWNNICISTRLISYGWLFEMRMRLLIVPGMASWNDYRIPTGCMVSDSFPTDGWDIICGHDIEPMHLRDESLISYQCIFCTPRRIFVSENKLRDLT